MMTENDMKETIRKMNRYCADLEETLRKVGRIAKRLPVEREGGQILSLCEDALGGDACEAFYPTESPFDVLVLIPSQQQWFAGEEGWTSDIAKAAPLSPREAAVMMQREAAIGGEMHAVPVEWQRWLEGSEPA